MNELLKALYDIFYEKLPATQPKAEIERCHQELIEKLSKPERKLVLQIIDCKDQIAEDLSIDSFIAGFRLAMRLSQELNIYEKGTLFQRAISLNRGCSHHIWGKYEGFTR